ncbi:MAG: helicase [Circoviridae sp.]|uniref:Replication-associated protein n=1 Tax=Circoviridae sp. TaxID=1954248 RepID=A0A345N1T9_9VIRU|nr:MAG: helicase [Circoviridae sp.]AXH77589.1 MAG: helicase [Circoviridae sp.]
MSRSRAWFLTENSQLLKSQATLEEECAKDTVVYAIMCKEVAPKTGHEHAHIYIYFKNARSFNCMKDKFPTADIEKAKGSPEQAMKYVSKDGDKMYEFGVCPVGRKSIEVVWKEAVDAFKRGEGDRESRIYAAHQSFFDSLELQYRKYPKYDGNLQNKNIWIYGPAGTGKSSLAEHLADLEGASWYNKMNNKWWNGYRDQKYVIMQDIDPDRLKGLVDHIKQWADRYPFTAELKNTARTISPAGYRLVITSNYSIEQCFPKEDDQNAIYRRFNVIELTDRPSKEDIQDILHPNFPDLYKPFD